MKEMIEMYIKCEKIKELAEKIEKETEYLFNEYKKIKEVIQNFLEQKEK